MIRRLSPCHFSDVWELGSPYIDVRLKPDLDAARRSYMHILSDSSCFAEGEFDGDQLVSVGMVTNHRSAYAGKGYGSVQLWLGSMVMLDRMIEWWDGRPVMRFMSLQFPINVRPGMYRALRQRGFERSGDMNMLWR